MNGAKRKTNEDVGDPSRDKQNVLFKGNLNSLSGKSLLSDSLLLLKTTSVGLLAHATTTPLTAEFVITIKEVSLDGINNLGEISLGVLFDGGESQSSGSLLANNLTKTSLSLDDSVRDLHLAAKSGQPDDDLKRIDIVGNQNKGGLLLLNQSGDMLDTILDHVGLLGGFDLLALSSGLSGGQKTVLLLSLGLRSVLLQQLEELGSYKRFRKM